MLKQIEKGAVVKLTFPSFVNYLFISRLSETLYKVLCLLVKIAIKDLKVTLFLLQLKLKCMLADLVFVTLSLFLVIESVQKLTVEYIFTNVECEGRRLLLCQKLVRVALHQSSQRLISCKLSTPRKRSI